ncbi:MAG: hypothetical protein L3J73_05280, partial [Thermoplasmata archaeon]|nr:hypothetical protein [Thermoplasmata archaeon]
LDGRRLRVGTDRPESTSSAELASAARGLLASGLERLARPPPSRSGGVRFFSLGPRPTHRPPN